MERLRGAYPGLFEFRFMASLPATGLFIVDPDLGGLMKVELYVPTPAAPMGHDLIL
jgi:hypothetical protein